MTDLLSMATRELRARPIDSDRALLTLAKLRPVRRSRARRLVALVIPIAATLVALGAIVITGCGSSSGSSPSGADKTSTTTGGASSSGKKIDVCKIITPADAEKVAGGPVEAQAPSSAEPLSSGVCIYKATGGGIRVSLLQVRVYPGPQFYGAQLLPDTKSIDLSGTDKAFVRTGSGGKSVDVQFVKDGKTGAVNFTDTANPNGDSTVSNVEAVAQKLADAL